MSDESQWARSIQIDEARIRDHLGEMVRGTVEETLNAILDAEADQLCGAGRYERSATRQDTRAGSYERTLQTSAALDEQSGSVAAGRCSGRISNGTHEAGIGSGVAGSCHRGRCALWLRASGCQLWTECAVPPGTHGAQRWAFRVISRCTLPMCR